VWIDCRPEDLAFGVFHVPYAAICDVVMISCLYLLICERW